jgi:precorrin-4/cobalt-precorrin-4 C11-methyltransferase
MSDGKVWFLGGGPGAPELLTLRAAETIAAADVVIWGRNLLMEEAVTRHSRSDAELMPWPPTTMAQILEAYERARDDGLLVARLYAGDPSVFGKMGEEIGRLRELALDYEIVPGVGSLGAAAAALEIELTTAGEASPPLVLARESALPDLADGGATLALFMAGAEPRELQSELEKRGYGPGTACAVAHRVSWPEQVLFTCSLAELAARVEEHGFDRQTLILVGPRPV